MTVSSVYAGSRQVQVEEVAPTPLSSTASTAVVTGSEMNMRPWRTLAYTISVVTNGVKWSVFGANADDFSDEVAVLSATTVAAAASSSYAASPAPYAYYRVKIIDDSGGSHGTATVRGIAKG